MEEYFEETSNNYLTKIKNFAFNLGLDIYSISIHNNFVIPSIEQRDKEVEK